MFCNICKKDTITDEDFVANDITICLNCEEKKDMKIFCKNCEYCKKFLGNGDSKFYECRKIREREKYDTPYHKSENIYYYNMNQENKDNNCKYYKPKLYRRLLNLK